MFPAQSTCVREYLHDTGLIKCRAIHYDDMHIKSDKKLSANSCLKTEQHLGTHSQHATRTLAEGMRKMEVLVGEESMRVSREGAAMDAGRLLEI